MKLTVAAALILLLAAAPAAAQQPTPAFPGMASFADFDTNGDGIITEQEFVDARNKRIAERAGEGRPMRGLAQAEEFKTIDTNGDGHLTREEFDMHQRRHMQTRPLPPAR